MSVESDRFGLTLSTSSATAAESYRKFVDAMLASSDGTETFLSAATAADDGFALVRIADAYTRLASGDLRRARELAAEAVGIAAGTTRREQHHIATLAAFINGETVRSTELVKEHLVEYPLDALMVFVAQFRLSFSGRRTWKQEIATLTEDVAPHYDADEWSILGLRAFRAEEERDLDAARTLAEHSLDLYPENARAAHVLAHTYFERGEHEDGYRFLDQWLAAHHPQQVFSGHLWWHIALHQLGVGDRAGACQTLRAGITDAGRSPFRVPDVASLLWRMDLYGLDADPADWQAASDFAAEVVPAPRFAFVDAHVVLAHAGAHQTERLNHFMTQLTGQSAAGNGLVSDVLLPLAHGIGAFADGDSTRAVRDLGPLVATGDLVRLGGSNAQREVFEDTFIAALVATGDGGAALDLLDQRLARRPSRIDERWRVMATT